MTIVLILMHVAMKNVWWSVDLETSHAGEKPFVHQKITKLPVPAHRGWKEIHWSLALLLIVDLTRTVPMTRPATTDTASHHVPLKILANNLPNVLSWIIQSIANVHQALRELKEHPVQELKLDAELMKNAQVKQLASTNNVSHLVQWQTHAVKMPCAKCWMPSLSEQ